MAYVCERTRALADLMSWKWPFYATLMNSLANASSDGRWFLFAVFACSFSSFLFVMRACATHLLKLIKVIFNVHTHIYARHKIVDGNHIINF